MHQEREYPGRVSGTDLTNPAFAAYARAFRAHAQVVEGPGRSSMRSAPVARLSSS